MTLSPLTNPSVAVNSCLSVSTGNLRAWVWYCDVCENHGTADSRDEAVDAAQNHAEYRALHDRYSECNLDFVSIGEGPRDRSE